MFAIWFCICLRSLYCMAGCIQKINVIIFEIDITSIFSVFYNLVLYTYLPLFFVLYGWLYSESSYGWTELSNTDAHEIHCASSLRMRSLRTYGRTSRIIM